MLDCTETDYEVTLTEGETPALTTIVETMPIVYDSADDMARQVVAQGMGALHLLTIGASGRALMSVHIGAGPSVATYYGECGDSA